MYVDDEKLELLLSQIKSTKFSKDFVIGYLQTAFEDEKNESGLDYTSDLHVDDCNNKNEAFSLGVLSVLESLMFVFIHIPETNKDKEFLLNRITELQKSVCTMQ